MQTMQLIDNFLFNLPEIVKPSVPNNHTMYPFTPDHRGRLVDLSQTCSIAIVCRPNIYVHSTCMQKESLAKCARLKNIHLPH